VIAADAEFHHVLAQATGNAIVDDLMRHVLQTIGEERRASLSVPGQVARAITGHREILDAVAARDPVVAEDAMRRHLRSAHEHIERWLAEATARSHGTETQVEEVVGSGTPPTTDVDDLDVPVGVGPADAANAEVVGDRHGNGG
jgi:hypothetical protein